MASDRATVRAGSQASPWRRRAALAGVAIGLLLAPACSDGPSGPGPGGGRVLVVGLDGATDVVIDPLLVAGQLPAFLRLREQGVRGALRPGRPILSPRI